jgi:hypothetical protein
LGQNKPCFPWLSCLPGLKCVSSWQNSQQTVWKNTHVWFNKASLRSYTFQISRHLKIFKVYPSYFYRNHLLFIWLSFHIQVQISQREVISKLWCMQIRVLHSSVPKSHCVAELSKSQLFMNMSCFEAGTYSKAQLLCIP